MQLASIVTSHHTTIPQHHHYHTTIQAYEHTMSCLDYPEILKACAPEAAKIIEGRFAGVEEMEVGRSARSGVEQRDEPRGLGDAATSKASR